MHQKRPAMLDRPSSMGTPMSDRSVSVMSMTKRSLPIFTAVSTTRGTASGRWSS